MLYAAASVVRARIVAVDRDSVLEAALDEADIEDAGRAAVEIALPDRERVF